MQRSNLQGWREARPEIDTSSDVGFGLTLSVTGYQFVGCMDYQVRFIKLSEDLYRIFTKL